MAIDLVPTLVWHRTAARPGGQLWWTDDLDELIDFTGVTPWELLIARQLGDEAVITKTTGITGGAGSGTPTDPDGEPNVTITLDAGELDDLGTGDYYGTLTAKPGTAEARVCTLHIRILGTVLPAAP